MNTILKLVVIGLALMMVAYLMQSYAINLYYTPAFQAPVIGVVSWALCILFGLGTLMLAKVSVGK